VFESQRCGGTETKQTDREAVKEEIKRREIKRVTESEIQVEGERIGNELIIQEENNRSKYLSEYHISIDTLLWGQAPSDSTARAILEVYEYAFQNGQSMTVGIQGSDKQNLYFCSPIQNESGYTGVYIMKMPRKYVILNYEIE